MKKLAGAGVHLVSGLAIAVRAVLHPASIAAAALFAGCGLLIAGIFVLFGLGAALLAGSAPFLLLAFILIRGLTNGQ